MKSNSASKKDYYGGILLLITGLSVVIAGSQYKLGSLTRMGAGFFPVAIGALLALTGLLIAAQGLRSRKAPESAAPAGHGPTGMPDLRGCACIILGILAFLLFGTYGGLIPATFAIVFISALGDRSNTLISAFAAALAMCVVAYIVFSYALQLQLQPFQWGR
ncbi:tripartite tricarboxylate transporter TctB family protein [Paraburkholderia antibiotica]|uniref:Tripartite tricarboxylate transporter TctB family protein n=1 Tax=Paraburkholderia antibiotica TaxID=2728839 RepID=A0A7X9X8A8_9BURK|nr:tripartite tricarboxylate transporter TctB family protein [Paraburkholderia antibiotica]NML32884.1 tripartite tricarboxylate transporter TctB family protein [Paraburkholderia antibiotica]